MPEITNNESRPADITPPRLNSSALVALLAIVIFGIGGTLCPPIADMLQDFGFEAHWRHAVCSAIRWQWTLPVALALAAGIIGKTIRLSPRANRVTNIVVLLVLVITAVAVFYTTMCYTIRGNTMTSPFGESTVAGAL